MDKLKINSLLNSKQTPLKRYEIGKTYSVHLKEIKSHQDPSTEGGILVVQADGYLTFPIFVKNEDVFNNWIEFILSSVGDDKEITFNEIISKKIPFSIQTVGYITEKGAGINFKPASVINSSVSDKDIDELIK